MWLSLCNNQTPSERDNGTFDEIIKTLQRHQEDEYNTPENLYIRLVTLVTNHLRLKHRYLQKIHEPETPITKSAEAYIKTHVHGSLQ